VARICDDTVLPPKNEYADVLYDVVRRAVLTTLTATKILFHYEPVGKKTFGQYIQVAFKAVGEDG